MKNADNHTAFADLLCLPVKPEFKDLTAFLEKTSVSKQQEMLVLGLQSFPILLRLQISLRQLTEFTPSHLSNTSAVCAARISQQIFSIHLLYTCSPLSSNSTLGYPIKLFNMLDLNKMYYRHFSSARAYIGI